MRRVPYFVGERGPEVVSMGGNRYVTPNHRLGGGNTGPVTIHVYESKNAKDTGREVMRQFNRAVGRSAQIGLDRE